jgi:protein TonB
LIEENRNVQLDAAPGGSASRAGAGPIGGFHLDLTAGDGGSEREWRGTDVFMRIITSSKPRYPESMRQAGFDGRVLVRFTVDTLGRVDMSTVQIVQSTHDLFSRAVRDALPGFRFKPAEVGGVRVRALAEMPFEFSLEG